MEFAVTLPQGGKAADPDSIKSTAITAERLGYSHVWVNDHITSPVGQNHPSPYMFDPLLALATAAAVTTTIGLGTQLTASYYSPLWLSNALASLDTLAKGRVTIAIGVGWSKIEFDALQSTFVDRGSRTNEIIEILRTSWREDFVPINTTHYQLPPVKIRPRPAHPIPIWISGDSEPAYRRAIDLGDGFHGEVGAGNIAKTVDRIRRHRPEPSFTFSVYTAQWDPSQRKEADILEEREIYEEAGVQHVVIALGGPDPDARLQLVKRLATILEL
jgi:probable F420-dependent oxidoreductase